mgnify:FL=1
MRWIGQHIWDFISRFRSDVYLEATETGTIASGGNLGLDSNNKIVKAAEVGSSVDLTSAEVTGVLTVDHGGTGASSLTDNAILTGTGASPITAESTTSLSASVSTTRLRLISPANSLDFLQIDTTTNGATTLTTVDGDAALANFEIAADGNITLDAAGDVALECGNNGFTCDAGNIDFSSSGANRPTLQMINSEDDATGPSILLKNNRDGNGLEDDDVLGEIKFVGEDASGNFEQYGGIIGSVVEADHGDEAGQIAISVANDGTERNGITMTADKGTAQEVDVTIANGTSSTTTIAGHLTVTTEATIPSRKYELPSSTVGDYKGGDVYYYGDGSTVKGKIYGIDGTNWSLADADSEAATKGLLAVALGTDPDVDGMLLRGFVTLLTEIEGTEAIGSPLYLSATDSGIATVTVPASGDFVRVLGYSLHASDNQVYFNPDNTWVERA